MADPPVNASDYRPPEQTISFVAWKLQIDLDSFYGRLLQLVSHADHLNLSRLRGAFPGIVEAWEAWQASDGGDFELPASTMAAGFGRPADRRHKSELRDGC